MWSLGELHNILFVPLRLVSKKKKKANIKTEDFRRVCENVNDKACLWSSVTGPGPAPSGLRRSMGRGYKDASFNLPTMFSYLQLLKT